ncbi:MAG: hypothetical protein JWP87_6399 [Labilithrix sp.]|nr:hypothetical protein [Labilithrix sp.]
MASARRSTRARSRIAALTTTLALAVAFPAATAKAQGTTRSSPSSPYEKSKIGLALDAVHGVVDPAPEGKIVEGIDVVPLEVIEEDDPAPRFLNIFHATTLRSTLKREVLLTVGEAYRQYRVDETVRSLRIFQQLSLVLAVPIAGSAPDRVRVLIVTKDVWSLRAQFDLKLGAGGLDLLRFEPTERNIAGTLDSAVTRFELYPNSLTLGGGYFIPRLADRLIYLVLEGNVVFERDSGRAEGSYGRVAASSPQLSADTPILWGVGTVWQDINVRRYVNAKLATFDAQSTPDDDRVPDVYRLRGITTTASVVRSYGLARKVDVTFGGELNVREYIGLDPALYDPRVVAEYQAKRVPTTDYRAAPWFQVRAYESRFLRIHDLELLALEEDYRIGYDGWLRTYPVTKAIGSSRDFLGLHAAFQYVAPLRTGFARATTEALTELQTDAVPTFAVAGNVMLVSPSFGIGRLVVSGLGIARPRNYLNQRSSIGGEGRLRGYPSAAFLGENLVAWNTELRSRPVEILSCQVGGALFFDVGDAFDGTHLQPKSSAGFGVRTLFPQLDRQVFRFDVAFPLVRGGAESPVGFYASFEQAFSAGAITAPGPAPAQSILSPVGGALGQ